ncbi:DNRLRE domain-containing protein [Nocardioides sp. BYT-33-1]|uniref:DNRLRE domain-containing protein n=1 Tax=Nocardioides sp. BYT-33-1 TaxID=3416952 RepID=UPI003F5350C8
MTDIFFIPRVSPTRPTRRAVRWAAAAAGTALIAASVQVPVRAAAEEPVAPDGTTTVTLTATADTWVRTGLGQPGRPAAPELQVGSSNYGLVKARSFLAFDTSNVDLAGATVVDAELTMSNFATGSCTGSPVRVSRVTSAWTESIKWSTQPQATATGSATTSTAYGRTGCADEGVAAWDATAIVQAWAGGAANHGVQVRADSESSATGYRQYRSLENGDSAKLPTLTITYTPAPEPNQPPATPAQLNATPGAHGWVRSATPTLSAVVSDPEGGPVAAVFEIVEGADVVWTGTSDEVASGGTASVQVPACVLAEGTAYVVTATARDEAGDLSAEPTALWLVVDTVAPTAAVSSARFVDGTWTTTVPSSDTLTLTGGEGTSWFTVTADGHAFVVGADASGVATVPYTPVAGWHEVVVVAGDPAGNVSEPARLSYGTGPAPVWSAPAANATSPASYAVEVSGPPGSSYGSLHWRVAGESGWRSASEVTTVDGTPWSGALAPSSARSTTGPLTWHATEEPYGSGTLAPPAVLQLRACFNYAGRLSCTDIRNLALQEAATP